MFLKTITLHGFKSFADPTRLDLQPGVTAIVGPNGCGKSNIADAIRWVLGEQSAKALRGGKMHDVIFQGSENRKPLPYCEVSLMFSNCEEQLGTQYHEVEISRKVTREGGSDYLLNGKVCRLKDIQSLFMDTGIGQVSYSFLLQGQIDQILSSNPLERRSIFEEAAGITRYKSQRKEALNKLNLVEQNLTRVTDIVEEIGKRMGTLKRQASKAVRYQRLKHRLTHLDIGWNAYQFSSFRNSSSDIRSKQAEAEAKLKETEDAIENLNRELSQRKIVRADIFQKVEELRNKLFTLRSAKENTNNQEQIKRHRIDTITERIEQLKAEVSQMRENAQNLSTEDTSFSDQMTTQHAAVAHASEAFKVAEAQLQAKNEELQQKMRDYESMKVESVSAEKQLGHFRSQATRLEVGLETYHTKFEDLNSAYHQYKSETETLTQQIAGITARLTEKTQSKSEIQETLATLEATLQRQREALDAAQTVFKTSEKEHTHLTTEAGVLENLQRKLEGFGAGTKAILQGKLDALVPPSQVDLLSQHIQLDPEYQAFGEALLGSLLESMVYSNPEKLRLISEFLTDNKIGEASFLLPSVLRNAHFESEKAPSGLTPASSHITASEKRLGPLLSQLLQGCYFAKDLPTALNALESQPQFTFQRIATIKGEVIRSDGSVKVGKASEKSGSYLQRQNELRKLRNEIREKEQSLHEKSASLDEIVAELDSLKAQRNENRDILETYEREIANLTSERSGLERSLSGAQQRAANYQKQLESLEQERIQQTEELAGVKASLEEAETTLEASKTAISRFELETGQLREEKDELMGRLSDAKIVLSEERQRLNSIEQTIAENKRRKTEVHERLEQYGREQLQAEKTIANLKEQILEDKTRVESIEQELESTNVELHREEASHAEFDAKISEIEETVAARREKERSDRESLQSINLSMSENEIYSRSLAEKIREEYDLVLEAIDWRHELWKANQKILRGVAIDDLDDESDIEDIAKQTQEDKQATQEELQALEDSDWDAIQEELQSLRQKLTSMGPVNTLAIEEYADLKERYEFLTGQSNDLWNSKNQLIKTIEEINKTSEAMFQETFEQIRINFKGTYNRLTGGGESDLQLMDDGDILDSGIDIIARPPGTRLRSLSLLSGGQKTMTAVALLFAIYAVKPSPFCVLDELDAPLDDANIGRFVEILKDFTRFSQFLIVSHNKRTIASSDSIFGVTMEEKGVSKLLSMRFNSDNDLIEKMVEPSPAS
jgi:chromosome segregation protein